MKRVGIFRHKVALLLRRILEQILSVINCWKGKLFQGMKKYFDRYSRW